MSMIIVREDFASAFGRIKMKKGNTSKEYTGLAMQDGKLYLYSQHGKIYAYEQLEIGDVYNEEENWNVKIPDPNVLKKMLDLMKLDFLEGADIVKLTKVNDGTIEIKNNKTRLQAPVSPVEDVKTGEYKRMTFAEEPTEYIEVTSQELLEIKSIISMTQDNDMQPARSAVYFKMKSGKLTYYCTDGYRLGQIESKATGTIPDGTYSVLSKYIKFFLKSFNKKSTGKIKISIHEDNMILQYGKLTSVMQCTTGRGYDNDIFSKYVDYKLSVDRKKLIKAVEALNKAYNAKQVIFEWNNEKILITDTAKECRTELPCEGMAVRGLINYRYIEVNPEFLIDTLKMFNEKTVTIEISGIDRGWCNPQRFTVKSGRKKTVMAGISSNIDKNKLSIGKITPEECEKANRAWQEYLDKINAEKEKQLREETFTPEEKQPVEETSMPEEKQQEKATSIPEEKPEPVEETFTPEEKQPVEEKPKKEIKRHEEIVQMIAQYMLEHMTTYDEALTYAEQVMEKYEIAE